MREPARARTRTPVKGPPKITTALQQWRELLGSDYVLTDEARLGPYQNAVSGRTRTIPAVLQPATTEEVQDIMRVAHACRIPVYPISCGRNWGLGSKQPAKDHTVVLDLHRLNRIRELSEPFRYAVVEAGVSQGALYDEIQRRNLSLTINCTGSGREASLIGNALERGGGYFGNRAEELSGLEVVLPNGDLIRTGAAHYAQSRTTHLFKYGIGPFIDGLFSQGHCGIVTSAGVSLLPKWEHLLSVSAALRRESDFIPFMNALVNLRQTNRIRSACHVGNRERSRISLGPALYDILKEKFTKAGMSPDQIKSETVRRIESAGFGPWNAVISVEGPKDNVRNDVRAICKALRPWARLRVLNAQRLDLLDRLSAPLNSIPFVQKQRELLQAVRPLFGLSQGIPTNHALKSVYWACDLEWPEKDLDPDPSAAGMLYCLPVVPLDGKSIHDALEALNRRSSTHATTVYMLNERAAELVISLPFRRDREGEEAKTHELVASLHEDFLSMGCIPYRIGIDFMHQVVDPKDPFWKTLGCIKNALDPHHIMAPGRYDPFS